MNKKTKFTAQQIVDNNLLIAAFLGGTVEEWYHNLDSGHKEYLWRGELANSWRIEKLNKPSGISILDTELRFHQSWDWIMPVWYRILCITKKYSNVINLSVILQVNSSLIVKHILSLDLPETYEVIVELIKYLNKIDFTIEEIQTNEMPKVEFICGSIVQIQI